MLHHHTCMPVHNRYHVSTYGRTTQFGCYMLAASCRRRRLNGASVCVQILSEFLIPTTRPPLSVAPGQGPKHRTVPTYCACSHELFSCWVWLCHAMAALAAQPPIMTRNNAAARQKGNTYISRKSMPACPAGILATAGCCKYCKSA